LIDHKYSPTLHLQYDENGILVPTNLLTNEFKNDILNYFKERKEDDCFEKDKELQLVLQSFLLNDE
jgi:hypothetical protein